MQCNAFLSQIRAQDRSSDLYLLIGLVLDLVVVVAELLAHVSRHEATLSGLALGLLDDGAD